MDPLTAEERTKLEDYDAIARKYGFMYVDGKFLRRIIAAARSSIPRPIAEAQRDGTYVDVWDGRGNRYTNSSFINGEWCDCEGYVFSVSQQPVSFLTIPKGCAS